MFGDAAVQADTAKRRAVLRDLAVPYSLSEWDREFCEEPGRLSERLTTFAKAHGCGPGIGA